MATISLKEIQNIAERESAQHHHYYIGVEHLFIALTKLDNGLTNAVLEHCEMEPRFVRYSIRQVIGINEERRYWPGFKETPRAAKVLEQAKYYAGIHNPTERDLLLAIIDEGDSIPVRTLEEMGADLQRLRVTASNWSTRQRAEAPRVPIKGKVKLSADEEAVLQRMFRTHERIVVERDIGGSYKGARLLVVQPHRAKRAEARVVVKIGERADILYEQRHYDSYVRDTLPPTTARLVDNPAVPEDCPLAGLKYTLVQPSGSTDPIDLRNYVSQVSGHELGRILRDGVYQTYAETWWAQRQRYRFGVWREYEHILPAAIEIMADTDANPDNATHRLKPLEAWSRGEAPVTGELVELCGFTVQKVRPDAESIQLAAGRGLEAVNRASKVEVVGLGTAVQRYRPGDIVDSFVGRVNRTREDMLRQQIDWLSPEFSLDAPMIDAPEPFEQLPNPLFVVDNFLNQRLSGYLSIIHGDLHLGNILVGPGGNAWLIDFGLTREGHVLFDWAVLEVSLLASVVAPRMPGGWSGVWGTARLLQSVNKNETIRQDNPVAQGFDAIRMLRHIVHDNLARPDEWLEYYVALALVALRSLSWEDTTNVDVRRLLFVAAALAAESAAAQEESHLTVSDMTRDTLTTQELRNLSNYDMSTPPLD